MSQQPRRPRVLMTAYMCAPGYGSEAGGGWNRAVESAKHCDTWVIAEESEFGPKIRHFLDTEGPIPGLQFRYVPQQPWESLLWHIPGFGYVAYNLWQRRALRAARRLHEEIHFDLVHQSTFGSYREPGYLWQLGVPFVWGPFGGVQNYPWRFLLKAGVRGACLESLRSVINGLQLRFGRRSRRAAQKAALVLSATRTVQYALMRHWGVVSVRLIDNGIAAVNAVDRTERMPGPLRILWVGVLAPRKALTLLLEALAQLPTDIEYELCIVGDGSGRQRLQRQARRKGIDGHTTWTGRLSHDETLKQYQWADVLVFSSLRDTTGTVALEAFGAGLPVVCLDHHGAHDMVNEDCGIRVPVTTPSVTTTGLANAIEQLARDREGRLQLGRGAAERAKMFVWQHIGERLVSLYLQTLAPDVDVNAQAGPVVPENNGWDSPVELPRPAFTYCRRKIGTMVGGCLRRTAGSRAENRFGILLYHRIANVTNGFITPEQTIGTQRFEQQLRGLLDRGFQPWPLQRVLDYCEDQRPIPPRTFVVTFDDGYKCVYDEAWPILQKLQIPATIFLITSELHGTSAMSHGDSEFCRANQLQRGLWRSVSVPQCREMLDSNLITLGSHTHTHADFRGKPELFRDDLRRSADVLSREFQITRPVFAFPFGYTSPRLAANVREVGMRCGLTTSGHLIEPASDPFQWSRFSVQTYDTGASLVTKLEGWYNVLERMWTSWKDRKLTAKTL